MVKKTAFSHLNDSSLHKVPGPYNGNHICSQV